MIQVEAERPNSAAQKALSELQVAKKFARAFWVSWSDWFCFFSSLLLQVVKEAIERIQELILFASGQRWDWDFLVKYLQSV